MAEPALKYCTAREGDGEWHLECRFSDGQKYAAIKIDGACPELATRVAALLNGNVWTDERPTEPGEYWVSIEPGKRGFNVPGRPTRPNRSVIPIVIEMDSVSFDPGMTVYFDQRGFGTSSERTGWIGKLDCGFFDGAKWSRRETPADPFKEVTT